MTGITSHRSIGSRLRLLAFVFFVGLIGKAAATDKLLPVSADITRTSVSGLSSGAFMTSQFYVAYSNIMVGAGIVAGGPYLCAQSWPYNTLMVNATATCMNPLIKSVGPNTWLLVKKAKALAEADAIDPLENLKNDRIYLFSGKSDRVVTTVVVDQTLNFFKSVGVPETSIIYNRSVNAGHAFITNKHKDTKCDLTQNPFVNDCDFEQADAILKHIYRDLKPAAENLSSRIIRFDQSEFIDAGNTSMSKEAFAYVPAACMAKENCPIHVVFHGCLQGAEVVGDKYYNGTGYNEIAEANDMIVLYPQVEPSLSDPLNPQGCWDFWGYSSPDNTNPDYYSRNAPQLRAVYKMIKRLSEPKGIILTSSTGE